MLQVINTTKGKISFSYRFENDDTPEVLEWTTASTTNMPFNPETLEENALKISKVNITNKEFIRNGKIERLDDYACNSVCVS